MDPLRPGFRLASRDVKLYAPMLPIRNGVTPLVLTAPARLTRIEIDARDVVLLADQELQLTTGVEGVR